MRRARFTFVLTQDGFRVNARWPWDRRTAKILEKWCKSWEDEWVQELRKFITDVVVLGHGEIRL